MNLYVFHERQIVGSLMDCTRYPDPRPEAREAGFVRGLWPGFAETPFADAAAMASYEFILGDDETGDLYRHAQIYPSQTTGDQVAFWFSYRQTRRVPGSQE